MSEDPYQILGVPRTATQSEIRKAYRKRAKELHPDLHPGDKKAEAQFKALSAAYHLLNDPSSAPVLTAVRSMFPGRLYGLRRELRTLADALRHEPDEVRQGVRRALSAIVTRQE